jgi:hypothetical protein
MHLQQPPDPLGRPDVPERLESVVRRLLGKDPLQRPAGAREVFDGLLPFTFGAGALGGIVPAAAATGGVHLYARALVRLTTPRPAPPAPAPAPAPQPAPHTVQQPVQHAGHRAAHHAAPAHAAGAVSSPGGPRPTLAPPWGGGRPVPYGGHPQPGHMRRHRLPETSPARTMGWKLRHSLWMLPTLSIGFLPWAAFLYIGLRHRHRWWLVTAAGYFVCTVLLVVLLIVLPEDSLLGGFYLLGLMVIPVLNAVIVNPGRLRLLASGR